MSDSYQPIFDAVRSRIHNADVGDAVERAIRERFDVSHVIALAQDAPDIDALGTITDERGDVSFRRVLQLLTPFTRARELPTPKAIVAETVSEAIVSTEAGEPRTGSLKQRALAVLAGGPKSRREFKEIFGKDIGSTITNLLRDNVIEARGNGVYARKDTTT